MCVILCLVSIFGISLPVFAGEIDTPSLRDRIPVLPGLWSSSCSPFLVELAAASFLLPRTSLLFYYSTDCLLGCLSAVTSLSRWFVSDTFQIFLSRCCTFSKLLLEMDWVVDFLVEAFFSICTLSRTCLCSKCKRAVEDDLSPGPAPCPLLLPLLREAGLWSLRLISRLSPQE